MVKKRIKKEQTEQNSNIIYSDDDVQTLFDKHKGKVKSLILAGENKKKLDVLSTGSLLLDYRIAFGGIPQGRITHIYGPTRSLKTSIGIKAMKSAFDKYGDPLCMVLDFERTMDYEGAIGYYKYLGLTDEQARNIIIARDIPEKCFDVAQDFVQLPRAAVLLVDSIGAMEPGGAYNKSFEENAKVAGRATLVKQFINRINTVNKNCAVIMINQVLDSFSSYGSMVAHQYTYGGGNSVKHMPSLTLDVKSYHVKDNSRDRESANSKIQLTVRIDKCKIGGENQSIPIMFDLATGSFDKVQDCLALGYELGILVQSASWYCMYDKPGGEQILLKSQGQDTFHHNIVTNPELLSIIETLVLTEIENNTVTEFESKSLIPDVEIDRIITDELEATP